MADPALITAIGGAVTTVAAAILGTARVADVERAAATLRADVDRYAKGLAEVQSAVVDLRAYVKSELEAALAKMRAAARAQTGSQPAIGAVEALLARLDEIDRWREDIDEWRAAVHRDDVTTGREMGSILEQLRQLSNQTHGGGSKR